MGRLIAALAPLAAVAATPPAALAGDWARPIAEASRRFAIPADWISRVIQAESGGRTTLAGRPIRSRAGAIGLMQLMPATWKEMREQHGFGEDPDDPRDNILAGTAYLRAMYERFGYPGLFAAYNAGPARYADSLATGRALSGETRRYLFQVAGGPLGTVSGSSEAAPPRLFVVRRDRVEAVPTRPFAPADSSIFAIRRASR